MSFTSTIFLFIFFPVTLGLYYVVRKPAREYVLLIASLLFYAFCSLEWFASIAGSIVITVCIGRILASESKEKGYLRRITLIIGIVFNAGALIYFKCCSYGFFMQKEGQSVTETIILPVGLSFVTFKAISYLADIYMGKADLSKNPVHDFLYLSFFTQITQGPLARYNDMAVVDDEAERKRLFVQGINRFIIGFNKKILLADTLSKVVDEVFAETEFATFSMSYAWLGAVCFSLELFFDFAGYSDMAIGLTNVFGYRSPENFNYPYATASLGGFWHRWHISLSTWFRDYVYIPLGGSRVKPLRIYFNLFCVWLLTALWHGTTGNFIAWGMLWFLAVAFEHLTGLPKRLHSQPLKVIYRILVLFFINFSWVIFHADDLLHGLKYIKRMLIPTWSVYSADNRTLFLLQDYGFFIICAILLSTPIVPYIEEKLKKRKAAAVIFEVTKNILMLLAFIWALSFVIAGQNNPFLYNGF